MTIGARIKEWRAHKNLKQDEACSLLGVPFSTYQKYEMDNRKPGAEALEAFARAGVNVNWLLTGEGKMLATYQVDNLIQLQGYPIDLVRFHSILERLSFDECQIRGLDSVDFGYYAALIYIRLMRVPPAQRESELELAVNELDYIELDRTLSNIEETMKALQKKYAASNDEERKDEILEGLQFEINSYTKLLGPLRGKFVELLGNEMDFDDKFIHGLGLLKSTDTPED